MYHHHLPSLKQSGFTLPAEWHPQQAILLAWPKNPDTWPGHLPEAQECFIPFIREIADHQNVWLLVESSEQEQLVRNRLLLGGVQIDRVTFFQIPYFDSWIRDYGPISLLNHDQKQRLFLDWTFNAWGDKYSAAYSLDNQVTPKLAQLLDQEKFSIPFVLEGGSIDANGEGILLTTKDCLLNQNRNAHFTASEIEATLSQYLGIKKIIWLDGEIQGDDTNGHVDDAARFVNPNTIVYIHEEDSSDQNYKALQTLETSLKEARDLNGRPFHLVRLPMPNPVVIDGERLPASYANFLITNQKVLLPSYGCPQDQIAQSILQELMPNHKVVLIDAVHLVLGYGSLHCLSQQIPAV
ncbi:MAG: agmatine deiminase family protein [Deltaproteobacteria bacterium]|nr:agmatine deiminase family protein [Deltaproteobacteria bacterium]